MIKTPAMLPTVDTTNGKKKKVETKKVDADKLPLVKIQTGTTLDIFFPEQGINPCLVIFAGIPNSGKTTAALKVAKSVAGKKKVLVIDTEAATTTSPEYDKTKFEVYYTQDLKETEEFLKTKIDEIGRKYGALIIDSISEQGEDDDYMPEKLGDLRNLADRSKHLKAIKKMIRIATIEALEGKRDPFIAIGTSHIQKLVRPDIVDAATIIDPVIDKNGNIIGGYLWPASTGQVMEYLAGTILLFKPDELRTKLDAKGRTYITVTALKTRGVPKNLKAHLYIDSTGLHTDKSVKG